MHSARRICPSTSQSTRSQLSMCLQLVSQAVLTEHLAVLLGLWQVITILHLCSTLPCCCWRAVLPQVEWYQYQLQLLVSLPRLCSLQHCPAVSQSQRLSCQLYGACLELVSVTGCLIWTAEVHQQGQWLDWLCATAALTPFWAVLQLQGHWLRAACASLLALMRLSAVLQLPGQPFQLPHPAALAKPF